MPSAMCMRESHMKAITPHGVCFVWLLSLPFVAVLLGHMLCVATAYFCCYIQCTATERAFSCLDLPPPTSPLSGWRALGVLPDVALRKKSRSVEDC